MREFPENFKKFEEAVSFDEVLYHPAVWNTIQTLYENPTEHLNIMVHSGSRLK